MFGPSGMEIGKPNRATRFWEPPLPVKMWQLEEWRLGIQAGGLDSSKQAE